jgi:hypothetical protein
MKPVLLLSLLLHTSAMAGQQPAFKSGVQLVTVPITVTNATRDQLITGGLQAGDFRLFEDGVAQEVTFFGQQQRPPISLLAVVDASGSMAVSQRIENGVHALRKVASGLTDGDERAPGGGSLRNILPALVGETGGVFWNVASPTDAEFAAMSLLNELKYQMSLGYTPIRPFDGTFRRIKVETTVKGLAVRHRGGYLALPTIK